MVLYFIGIGLGEKYNCVCRDAIPSFTTCRVLHQIDPLVTGRKRVMFMPIPFGDFGSFFISDTPQNLQLIVEIVKYNCFWMIFQNF